MSREKNELTAEGELYPSPRNTLEYLDVEPPAPGHAVQLGDGLTWARIPLPMELNHINVWLLRDADGWQLVDTGLADDVCREAWHRLEADVLRGESLRRIVLTHDHPDHMGLARWLHERHGADVWMSAIGHSSTAEFLAAPGDVFAAGRFAFAEMHGMDVSEEAQQRGAGEDHGRWFGGLPPLDRVTAGGDRIAAGGRDWDVIETSGHCRGHLCLYDARNEVLISGDQVLPTISPNVSVLPSRPDANPLAEYLESIARLERCAPQTLVLPSHGRPFRGLHRRIEVLRSHHLQKMEALHEACRDEPRCAYELLAVMFGRPLRGFHRFLGVGETVAHLNCLWHAGRLERQVDDLGRIRFLRK